MLIAAVCAASACFPGSGPTGVGFATGNGGGAVASGRLAFLVQPNNVAAGSPISPEVKIIAVDSLGDVVPDFNGTVSVTLSSGVSGAVLSGTTSVAGGSGLAIFPSLVISQVGTGYRLIASAPGLVSASSAPFTVF
jgi:hypothetical protein